MSYESNELGYELGYDCESAKGQAETSAAQQQLFPEQSSTTYFCITSAACKANPKNSVVGSVCVKEDGSSESLDDPPAPPKPADPKPADAKPADAKPAEAKPAAGVKEEGEAAGKKDDKKEGGQPAKPPGPLPPKYQGAPAVPAKPVGWVAESEWATQDMPAVEALQAKKLSKEEITLWLQQNPDPKKRDINQIKAQDVGTIRADMKQKEIDRELGEYEKSGVSPELALRSMEARGLIKLDKEVSFPDKWPKAEKGQKLDYGKVLHFTPNKDGDTLAGKKLYQDEKTELAQVKTKEEKNTYLKEHTRRVQVTESWIADMKKQGYSREQSQAYLQKMDPPLLDKEGRVTQFNPDEAAGYLYEAPAEKAPAYPINKEYQGSYDKAAANLKAKNINPDTFFKLHPPPTGDMTKQEGNFQVLVHREQAFYDKLAHADEKEITQLMARGNAVQWLEHKKAQGKDFPRAWKELQDQGVLSQFADRPQDNWPSDYDNVYIGTPSAPAPTVDSLKKSHAQLEAEKRSAAMAKGEAAPKVPSYTIVEGGKEVTKPLKPGEVPPPGAKVDKADKVSAVAADVGQMDADAKFIREAGTGKPPGFMMKRQSDWNGVLSSEAYGAPPIFDADGKLRPDASPERVAAVKKQVQEDQKKIYGAKFEFDENNNIVYKKGADGKLLLDGDGNPIPKVKDGISDEEMKGIDAGISTERDAFIKQKHAEAVVYHRNRVAGQLLRVGVSKDDIGRYMNGKGYLGEGADLGEMAKEGDRLEAATSKTDMDKAKKEVLQEKSNPKHVLPTGGPALENWNLMQAGLDPKAKDNQGGGGKGGNTADQVAAELRNMKFQKEQQEDAQAFQKELAGINQKNKLAEIAYSNELGWKTKQLEMALQLKQTGGMKVFENGLNVCMQGMMKSFEKSQDIAWQQALEAMKRTDMILQGMQQTLQTVLSSLFPPGGAGRR